MTAKKKLTRSSDKTSAPGAYPATPGQVQVDSALSDELGREDSVTHGHEDILKRLEDQTEKLNLIPDLLNSLEHVFERIAALEQAQAKDVMHETPNKDKGKDRVLDDIDVGMFQQFHSFAGEAEAEKDLKREDEFVLKQEFTSDNAVVSKTLLKQVPNFGSDTSPSKLYEFFAKLDAYFNAAKLDESDKVVLASSKLVSTANVWWRAQLRMNKAPTTWFGFKEELKASFTPPEHQRAVRLSLQKLKQTGSVKQYIDKFNAIRLQLEKCSKEEEEDNFYNGLKESIRQLVASNADNMSSLIKMQLAAVRVEGESSSSRRDDSVGLVGTVVVVCQFCDKKGHDAKRCWKIPGNKPAKKQNGQKVGKKTDNKKTEDNSNSSEEKDGPIHEGAVAASVLERNQWILDTGASISMTPKKEQLESYTHGYFGGVKIGDGRILPSVGKGEMSLTLDGVEFKLADVLHVPKLEYQLISLRRLLHDNETKALVEPDCLTIFSSSDSDTPVSIQVNAENGTFKVKNDDHQAFISAMVWHKRMGHLGMRNVKALTKVAEGVVIDSKSDAINCETCPLANASVQPFPESQNRANEALELIHSDVMGPFSTYSLNKKKYIVTFIDDKTRYAWIDFVEHKSETFEAFKRFKAVAELQYNKKIKILRTDNGGEYCSNEFESFLTHCGIIHQKTVPYTPEQNGRAERFNRTLMEKVRAMLLETSFPRYFWAELASTACYLYNRSPHSAIDMTPFEAINGMKPNLRHLRVIGCRCFSLIKDGSNDKLSQRSQEARLVGYDEKTKGFRLWNGNRIYVARDVKFHEDIIPTRTPDAAPTEDEELTETSDFEPESEYEFSQDSTHTQLQISDGDAIADITDASDTILQDSSDVEPSTVASEARVAEVRSSTSVKTQPDNFQDIEWGPYGLALVATESEPKTIRQAFNSTKATEWKKAVQSEYDSLMKNETWELCTLPKDRKAITNRWVFKVKHNPDGSVNKYKARLVARGFNQVYGLDYDETFAPVAKLTSIRVLISLALSVANCKIHQMDVQTAFLYGELSEEIYMEIPDGVGLDNEKNAGKVCKLKKSLYGLKQAPRCWNEKLHKFLVKIGFTQLETDHAFYKKQGVIIAVYVDDLLIVANDADAATVKAQLMAEFVMTDLGIMSHYLGMKLTFNFEKRTAVISQKHYIEDILNRFNLSDMKEYKTPMDHNNKMCKFEDSADCDQRQYQAMVGCVMFLMLCTRPDIAFAVGKLSQYSAAPKRPHLEAVKHLFGYLKATKDYCLVFDGNHKLNLSGYVDSDWSSCLDTRRSTSGYFFTLGSAAISWKSQKQRTVTLSSAEAEYVAQSVSVQEAIWLKSFVNEVGMLDDANKPVTIFSDSQSAIALAKNPVHHQRTKHIDIRHHFIREAIQNGQIEMKYVKTQENPADILTKPLPGPLHVLHSKSLGLLQSEEH